MTEFSNIRKRLDEALTGSRKVGIAYVIENDDGGPANSFAGPTIEELERHKDLNMKDNWSRTPGGDAANRSLAPGRSFLRRYHGGHDRRWFRT